MAEICSSCVATKQCVESQCISAIGLVIIELAQDRLMLAAVTRQVHVLQHQHFASAHTEARFEASFSKRLAKAELPDIGHQQ